MICFDCFELVERLEFHVCTDTASTRQYFLEDMTWFQVSRFNKFFQARTTRKKILRQLNKTQFIRVFPQET